MNAAFAYQLAQLLDRSGLLSAPVPPERLPVWLDEQSRQWTLSPAVLPLPHVLVAFLPVERCATFNEAEHDSFERGLFTFEDLLPRFCAATQGEWPPLSICQSAESSPYNQDIAAYILLDFLFAGQTQRWKIKNTGWVDEGFETVLQAFASAHLSGQFFEAGDVDDGERRWYYVPRSLYEQLRRFVRQVRSAWPDADELVSFFRTPLPPPPQPYGYYGVWDNVFQLIEWYSELVHLHDVSSRGERPLHVLVQEVVRERQHGRSDKHPFVKKLIYQYGADPAARDSRGRTAFDYAQGDEVLLAELHAWAAQKGNDSYREVFPGWL